MRAHCSSCSIAGGRKRRRQDAGSNALQSPSRPAGTAFGWRAGSRARDIEAYVIHASSIAVSREHRRAKTDRLDTKSAQTRLSRLAARGAWITARSVVIPTVARGGCPRRPGRERGRLRTDRHHGGMAQDWIAKGCDTLSATIVRLPNGLVALIREALGHDPFICVGCGYVAACSRSA